MDFPLADLMDEAACYARLLRFLHPDGLACPRCRGLRFAIHRCHRAPVLDYRCRDCRRVFNAFTDTPLHKTGRPPSTLLLILRGFARGVPTAQLARELGCSRMKLLALRHRLRAAAPGPGLAPPDGEIVEADERDVNGGKGRGAASRGG